MSRENDLATLLRADSSITAVLAGGIYADGELGIEGIGLDSTPDAFDGDKLLPVALVKQRGIIPTADVTDFEQSAYSVGQTVEVWLYQAVDYLQLDIAVPLIFRCLQGVMLDGSFELQLVNVIDRQRDTGALIGASLIRMDFYVAGVIAQS